MPLTPRVICWEHEPAGHFVPAYHVLIVDGVHYAYPENEDCSAALRAVADPRLWENPPSHYVT